MRHRLVLGAASWERTWAWRTSGARGWSQSERIRSERCLRAVPGHPSFYTRYRTVVRPLPYIKKRSTLGVAVNVRVCFHERTAMRDGTHRSLAWPPLPRGLHFCGTGCEQTFVARTGMAVDLEAAPPPRSMDDLLKSCDSAQSAVAAAAPTKLRQHDDAGALVVHVPNVRRQARLAAGRCATRHGASVRVHCV